MQISGEATSPAEAAQRATIAAIHRLSVYRSTPESVQVITAMPARPRIEPELAVATGPEWAARSSVVPIAATAGSRTSPVVVRWIVAGHGHVAGQEPRAP